MLLINSNKKLKKLSLKSNKKLKKRKIYTCKALVQCRTNGSLGKGKWQKPRDKQIIIIINEKGRGL